MQAALVLAAFYASPALASVALDDFHAVALAGLPLAAGLALVLAAAPRGGIALISMFVEEEAALAVIGLGGLLFVLGRRALGLVVALLAALWIAAMVFAVMPAFHDPRTLDGAGGNRTLGHFADLRADPGAALTRAVPDRAADSAMWLVLPTAGLGLLAPATSYPPCPRGSPAPPGSRRHV